MIAALNNKIALQNWKPVAKRLSWQSLKITFSIVNYAIKIRPFWQLFNYVYERAPWKIVNVCVRCIEMPHSEREWQLRLSNGRTVKTLIKLEDEITSQFALSYQWHAPELNRLELILETYYPQSVCYIDIGANAGIRSLLALSNGRTTLMIEPNAAVNRLNVERAELNGFSNFKLIEAGVSLEEGTAELYIDHSSYLSSLEAEAVCSDVLKKKVKIPITTLDCITKVHSIGAGFFAKIDVEGHEWEVIKGGKHSIERDYPTLIIEINKKGEHVQRILTYFSELGYTVFSIVKRPKYRRFLKLIDISSQDEDFLYDDFLFVRERGLLNALKAYVLSS